MSRAKVAIARCNRYELEIVKETLERMIGITDFPLVENKYILIKPNVLSDSPVEKHITTNPIVVKALIRILKEKGAGRIIVGDSPGLPGAAFKPKNCGIWDVCIQEDVEWVDFSQNATLRTLSSGFKVLQTSYLDECDIVISVAKMKTHLLMKATGCVKNMFGTVPGLNKSPMHLKAPSPEAFSRVIVDIYSTHIPEYSIMDGIISMEGAGPANGTPRQTNLLFSSASSPAIDKAEAIIMGYNTSEVPILAALEEKNKGITDGLYPILSPYDLVIKNYRRVEDKKRSLFSSLILPYFKKRKERTSTFSRPTPFFNKDKCKRCSKCILICPLKALRLSQDGVLIDKEKCIRCYCCHEICPFDAIEIKRESKHR